MEARLNSSFTVHAAAYVFFFVCHILLRKYFLYRAISWVENFRSKDGFMLDINVSSFMVGQFKVVQSGPG